MENTMPVNKFFRKVKYSVLTKLETYKAIEQLTDGFHPDKLQLLCDDFEKFQDEENRNQRQSEMNCARFKEKLREIREKKIMPVKLNQPQVALLHVYEGKTITKKNANEIATHYHHKSGGRLYNMFTKYSSLQNRTGGEAEGKKFRNKIELIESVIPLLEHNKEAQRQAQKEVAEMKQKEKQYQ